MLHCTDNKINVSPFSNWLIPAKWCKSSKKIVPVNNSSYFPPIPHYMQMSLFSVYIRQPISWCLKALWGGSPPKSLYLVHYTASYYITALCRLIVIGVPNFKLHKLRYMYLDGASNNKKSRLAIHSSYTRTLKMYLATSKVIDSIHL